MTSQAVLIPILRRQVSEEVALLEGVGVAGWWRRIAKQRSGGLRLGPLDRVEEGVLPHLSHDGLAAEDR